MVGPHAQQRMRFPKPEGDGGAPGAGSPANASIAPASRRPAAPARAPGCGPRGSACRGSRLPLACGKRTCDSRLRQSVLHAFFGNSRLYCPVLFRGFLLGLAATSAGPSWWRNGFGVARAPGSVELGFTDDGRPDGMELEWFRITVEFHRGRDHGVKRPLASRVGCRPRNTTPERELLHVF